MSFATLHRASALILLAACHSQADRPESVADNPATKVGVETEVPSLARLAGKIDPKQAPCLAPDSLAHAPLRLVFADAVVDTVYTQDVAGVMIHLVFSDSTVEVAEQEAHGEWGSPHRIDSARIDLGTRAASLWIDQDYHIQGWFSCDSLWGEATLYGRKHPFTMHRAASP